MKKALFAIAAIMMVFSVIGAQAASKSKGFDKKKVYVGGTVGFTSTSQSSPGGTSTDGSSFKLIVDAGYDLDKTNSAGVQVGFFTGLASMGSFDIVDISGLAKTLLGGAADLQLDGTSGFRIAPYVRHNLISNKTFDVFVEGILGFESVKTTTSVDDGEGNIVEQGRKATVFELLARPGFALKLTKDFKLTARMGAAGYQSVSTSAISGNNSNDGPKISRFGIDVATSNLLFGVEYHF